MGSTATIYKVILNGDPPEADRGTGADVADGVATGGGVTDAGPNSMLIVFFMFQNCFFPLECFLTLEKV